jgi:hypothetical protein
MTYNRVLELKLLTFLRVRIGTTYTPEELFKEVSKLAATTEEEFNILVRILSLEELIEVISNVSDDGIQVQKIVGITKGGLEMLRARKY